MTTSVKAAVLLAGLALPRTLVLLVETQTANIVVPPSALPANLASTAMIKEIVLNVDTVVLLVQRQLLAILVQLDISTYLRIVNALNVTLTAKPAVNMVVISAKLIILLIKLQVYVVSAESIVMFALLILLVPAVRIISLLIRLVSVINKVQIVLKKLNMDARNAMMAFI